LKKNSVGLLELETAVLECFFEKTPLNSLGVKLGVEPVNPYRSCMWTTGPIHEGFMGKRVGFPKT
jgi:hypothetical protein